MKNRAVTHDKGDLGVAEIIADVTNRGYKIAIPLGANWPYDLIVLRKGALERVQCKFTISDGASICVRCMSSNNWCSYKYSNKDVDWIAVYDKTTDRCYYVPSKMLGRGRAEIKLRVVASRNGQTKRVNWASDFLSF